MKIYKEILGRAAAKLRRVPLRFRVELVKEVPKGGGMWYNSFKQSLKHWKNACRRETPPAAKRQRHFSQRLALRVWYDSFKQSLKHWKNVCRRETPPAAMRQRHFSQRPVWCIMI